jgi:aconitate hydratase
VGGNNYGQGSSREHAALAPRFLGLRAVFAKSFARIHAQNLVNFGILPLTFENPADWGDINQNDVLRLENLRTVLQSGRRIEVRNLTRSRSYRVIHQLSGKQLTMALAGGLINAIRQGR